MARRGSETVRKRRGFHERMCWLPQTPTQYELCVHHAHPRSTMRARGKGILFGELVLSLSLLGCAADEPKISAVLNQSASLVGQIPANPLQWKIITSSIDRAGSTMSTLYGNDLAIACARTSPQHDYPVGAELSLVTWTQAEDTRWF